MTRSGFFRTVALAPLAFLGGCKTTDEPRVLRDTRDESYRLSVPATWTCDTANASATNNVVVSCTDGGYRWVVYETNTKGDTVYALARNYVP